MNRVFISYSRRNKTFAARLACDLVDAGLEVWIDFRQIHGGELWEQEIYRGLERSDFIIACLSPAALASEWVKRELLTARRQKKPIIPVMLVDSTAALRASPQLQWLEAIQYVLFENRYEHAFPELLQALPGARRISAFDDFDPEKVPNPFKGLEAFQQRDAAFFFGREDLTRKALRHLQSRRFLAVVGASGSGKSSLVRAGIIPQIRQNAIAGSDSWPVIIFSPTDQPMRALAERLHPLLPRVQPPRTVEEVAAALHQPDQLCALIEEALRDAPPDARLQMVIDQFEEVFTRASASEQTAFVSMLNAGIRNKSCRLNAIITMRADFFGELSHFPGLAQLFEGDNLLIVTEMTGADLRRAIEGPAIAVGLNYEAGLVDRILEDVRSQPGSLPLLQYALRELFKRREGSQLTMAAYDAIGGVRQALARHAESIFQALPSAQRDLARRVLLRLIEVSETGEATRRQVARSDIGFRGIPDATVQGVIDILTAPDARLLIASREIAPGATETAARTWLEISHEALIREWDRFKSWVSTSADDLHYESDLRKAAHDWDSSGRDVAYLLTGKRLSRAEFWLERADPTDLQRVFIQASLIEHRRQEEIRQAQLERELELQQKAARRLRLTIGLLAVFLVGAIIGFITVTSINTSLEQTNIALDEANILLDQQVQIAQANAQQARSLSVAANAGQAFSDRDTDLALALALAANASEPVPVQSQRMLTSIALEPGTRLRVMTDRPVTAIDYSPDGRQLLAGMVGGRIALYDVHSGTEQIVIPDAHASTVTAARFSPGGQVIASAADSPESSLKLWEAGTGQQIASFEGHAGAVNQLVFLNENTLLSAGEDGQLIIWDLQAAGRFGTIYSSDITMEATGTAASGVQVPQITALASGSGPGVFAAGLDNGVYMIYDLNAGGVRLAGRMNAPDADDAPAITALSFVSDGSQLIIASGGDVAVLDAISGEALQTSVLSPDGVSALEPLKGTSWFTGLTGDEGLTIWDGDSLSPVQYYNLDATTLSALRSSPDGLEIAAATSEGDLRFWTTRSSEVIRQFPIQEAAIRSVGLSHDGRLALTGLSSGDLVLWDISQAAVLRYVQSPPTVSGVVASVALSPDGMRAASGASDQSVTLWNTADFSVIATMREHNGSVLSTAFSPDGMLLATGSADNQIILWDAATGARIHSLDGHSSGIAVLVFSNDGSRVLSGDFDGQIILWDVASATAIHRLRGHSESIRSVAINQAGTRALSGAADQTVRVWDLSSGRELRRFDDHEGVVTGVGYLGDESLALSSSTDGTLRLWDVSTGFELYRYDAVSDDRTRLSLGAMVVEPESSAALTLMNDRSMRLWRIFPTLETVVNWARANRYVPILSCDEQIRFNILMADRVFVDIPDGGVLELQSEPGNIYEPVVTIQSGEPVQRISGQQRQIDGSTWQQVCTLTGLQGWVPDGALATTTP